MWLFLKKATEEKESLSNTVYMNEVEILKGHVFGGEGGRLNMTAHPHYILISAVLRRNKNFLFNIVLL
jgi:hypothetical protein